MSTSGLGGPPQTGADTLRRRDGTSACLQSLRSPRFDSKKSRHPSREGGEDAAGPRGCAASTAAEVQEGHGRRRPAEGSGCEGPLETPLVAMPARTSAWMLLALGVGRTSASRTY